MGVFSLGQEMKGNLRTDPSFTAFGDSPNNDAFGRLRVSNEVTLFNSDLVYDEAPLFWNTSSASGGALTHNSSRSAARLSVTTTTGSRMVRQSKQYFRYQPGKSQYVAMTFVFDTGEAGIRQRVGYFDDSSDGGWGDGVFLERDGTTVNLVRRTSADISGDTGETVAQSAWNVDPMDGTGPSGKTINWANSQIFTLDFQWLGNGRVRCGFDLDGVKYTAHEFQNANARSGVYMKTATLPVRYEIETTGTPASSAGLEQICCTVISEGGQSIDNAAKSFEIGNGITAKRAINSSWTPVLSIRPAPTLNGQTNRTKVLITSFEAISDTEAEIAVVYNPTLNASGLSWTNVNSSHSAVQYDVGSTALSGGITFDGAYIPAGGNKITASVASPTVSEYPFTLDLAGSTGSGTPVTIAMRTSSGSSAAALIKWLELY